MEITIEKYKDGALVRYCPACGSIGDISNTVISCCPEGNLRTYIPPKTAYFRRADLLASAHPVLDPCCGARMFYFNKTDNRVLFCDTRKEVREFSGNRILNVDPA